MISSAEQSFFKFDPAKAYDQVLVVEEVIMKAAVVTPFSLQEFSRKSFKLRNEAQTFHS